MGILTLLRKVLCLENCTVPFGFKDVPETVCLSPGTKQDPEVFSNQSYTLLKRWHHEHTCVPDPNYNLPAVQQTSRNSYRPPTLTTQKLQSNMDTIQK